MMLSKTSQYALQALIYMATQRTGTPLLSRDIARKINASATYLAKILQILCRHGLLTSYRGKHGGFSLDEGTLSTRVIWVISLVEGPSFLEECPLGIGHCSAETPCPIYEAWYPMKNNLVALLEQLTIEDMAKSVMAGRYNLANVPGLLMTH